MTQKHNSSLFNENKKMFLWTTFYNAHKFQNCSFVKLIVNFLDSPCNLFNLWLLLDKYCVYQNMVLGKFNKEKEFSFLHIFIHKKRLLEIFGKSFIIKALRKFDYVLWLYNKGFANQLTGFLFKKILIRKFVVNKRSKVVLIHLNGT